MPNKYISRYAKHDTHFERVSDNRYYFDDTDNTSFIKTAIAVAIGSCLLYGGIYFLLTF